MKTTKYYTVNLPSRSRVVAMIFQALSLAILSLYDFLLRSYIAGKLPTQSINFSSNSSLQLTVYKNTTAVNKQQLFLPVVTRLLRLHAQVGCCSRTTQRVPRNVTAGHSNQPPSKPQIWLLRAASRLRKCHCVVVKNKGLRLQTHTPTLRICTTCFSTPTMVTRTRLNVTLYVRCLSCIIMWIIIWKYELLTLYEAYIQMLARAHAHTYIHTKSSPFNP